MRVVFTPRFEERLFEIESYIAADNPDAADRWLEGVIKRVESLDRFARRGRKVPEAWQWTRWSRSFGDCSTRSGSCP